MLAGDDWTEGEKFVLRWQFRELGHFWTHMFEAFVRADHENLDHLARAFPEVVAAVRSWREGDLGDRFTAAGLLP